MILVGPPGSGKSTYALDMVAKNANYVRVNRDDLRQQFKGAYVVSEDMEKVVSKAQDALIAALLTGGHSVIVDNTHCKLKYIKELITKYHNGTSICVKYIGADTTLKELKKRNDIREKKVPEEVIERMYKGFNTVVKAKAEIEAHIDACYGTTIAVPYKQDNTLPKAIIVDIDGTIAHMGDGRGPFEWHKVDQDAPDEAVLSVIRTLAKSYNVIFMSGRDESCRALTEEWLDAYYGPNYKGLFMRPANNYEKDNIVKRRLFDENIKGQYYIEAVFDDRDQVVSMWRKELGLKCFQVEYGNF